MSITEELAKFAFAHPYSQLPARVVQNTKECIIDTLSGALAATSYPDVRGIIQSLLTFEKDQNTSLVWGTNQRTSLQTALLLNGTMGHTTEMDDVHKLAKTHVGAIVVPAALTLGEYLGASGKEVLRAVALGYEIALRIGIGIGASSHRLMGWHATGTCGIFASAAAAALLLQLDEAQFVSALGLAGTQASGLWAFTADGASCKKFHAGKAAHGGVLAALLARGGMTGPRFILEAADGGLYKASSQEYDYAAVTKDLGNVWEIMNIDRKPFPCCRSTHPAIDAVMQLQGETVLRPQDVSNIEVETYEVGYKQCGLCITPKNISEAQFSIPYTVAVTFYDHVMGLAQFSEKRIQDPEVLELARKVKVISSTEFTAEYPKNWGCRLTITLQDGQQYQKHIVNAKGDHEVPLTLDDLRAKFISLSGNRFSAHEITNIIDRVMDLENRKTVELTERFSRC